MDYPNTEDMDYIDVRAYIERVGYVRVFTELERIRLSGKCNMFSYSCVRRHIEDEMVASGLNKQIYSKLLFNWPEPYDYTKTRE